MSIFKSIRNSLFSGLFGVCALFDVQGAIAGEISYLLSGVVQVGAAENAVDDMIVGLNAAITVHDDGSVSGEGRMIYLQMNPCEWEPPNPNGSPAPWCRTDGVEDGTFTVNGEVLETMHRHDDDNPYKDAIFSLADKYSTERLGYAPLKIRLQLVPGAAPKELLTFWGFPTRKTEYRTTGAATLGVLVSGAFNVPFEIVPIDPGSEVEGLNGHNIYTFEGSYAGLTPAFGKGRLALTNGDLEQATYATDPAVYLTHWTEGIADRPFSDVEQAAIDARRDELAGDLSETVQALNDLDSAYANLDLGPPPAPEQGQYSPVKLWEDTRAN